MPSLDSHTSQQSEAALDSLRIAVVDWLNHEAELLDDLREREWLETMVSPDIVYRMPIRQTVRRTDGRGFIAGAYHLNENYGSLMTRVQRGETPYAWAEDPPSPSRHFVSNIRVQAKDARLLDVKSNLLLFRSRGGSSQPMIFSAERHDCLCRTAGSFRLVERTVYLDIAVLETNNLAVIF